MSRSGRTGHDKELAQKLLDDEYEELWQRWNKATEEGVTTLPWGAWKEKQMQYARARKAAGVAMDPTGAYSGWL